MLIYAVTPIAVSAKELARRQARYDALCPPGLGVVLHDVGPEAPQALETTADVRDSEDCVVRALLAAPAGFDALLPDCVLDPGVERLTGRCSVPVLGLLRISAGWSVCTGRTVGAVARNKPIAVELAERVDAYGWSGSFAGVEVLDLDVAAIAAGDRWASTMHDAVDRFARSSVGTVINGCSAVDLPGGSPFDTVRVVDPTALALRLIAAGETP